MKKEYGREEFAGEIGLNIPLDEEEKEEDLLENIYSFWKSGKSLRIVDVAAEMGIKTREANTLVRRMVRHGYVFEPDEGRVLELTDFGKAQGAECIRRHRMLSRFLQTVGGQSAEKAEEEACRLEHRISRETADGISDFLMYGDIYDHVSTSLDLCRIAGYEDGEYEMKAGIYYRERRAPRLIAREDAGFLDTALLLARDGRRTLALRRTEEKEEEALWYVKEGDWVRAEKQGPVYTLPTDAFRFVKSKGVPIIEGMAQIALMADARLPIVLDCRDLCVHIW